MHQLQRQSGKEHVDFEALSKEGAFAFTDDGVGVQESAMMKRCNKLQN